MKMQIINRIASFIAILTVCTNIQSAAPRTYFPQTIKMSRVSLNLPRNISPAEFCKTLQHNAVVLFWQDELYVKINELHKEIDDCPTTKKSLRSIVQTILEPAAGQFEAANMPRKTAQNIIKVFAVCCYANKAINKIPEFTIPQLKHLNWAQKLQPVVQLGAQIIEQIRENPSGISVQNLQRYSDQISEKITAILEDYRSREVIFDDQYQEITYALRKEIFYATNSRNCRTISDFEGYLEDFADTKDGGPYELPDSLLTEAHRDSCHPQPIATKTTAKVSLESKKTPPRVKKQSKAQPQPQQTTSPIIPRAYKKDVAYAERDGKMVYIHDPENNMDITVDCSDEGLTYSTYPTTTLEPSYNPEITQFFNRIPTGKELGKFRRNLQKRRFTPLVDRLLCHAREYLEFVDIHSKKKTVLCLDQSTRPEHFGQWIHHAEHHCERARLRVELDGAVTFTQEKQTMPCTFTYFVNPITHQINHRIMEIHKE